MAFAIAALAAAVGLVLDGTGFFLGASKAFAVWLESSGIAGEGAVSVPALGVLATVLASLFTAWVVGSAVRLREVIWVPLATGLLVFTGDGGVGCLGCSSVSFRGDRIVHNGMRDRTSGWAYEIWKTRTRRQGASCGSRLTGVHGILQEMPGVASKVPSGVKSHW